MNTRRHLLLPALTLFWLACGSAETLPEDMSARAHDKEAKKDQQASDSFRDDDAVREPGEKPSTRTAHFALASAYAQSAEDHTAAAASLRADESAECRGEPEVALGTCPLMSYKVTAFETTPEGVRVTYAKADPDLLLREVRCHLAHGATQGRKGMEPCPLYQKGLRAETQAAPGGAVLFLSTDFPDVRKSIQSMYVQDE
jgi:hypothetical protein